MQALAAGCVAILLHRVQGFKAVSSQIPASSPRGYHGHEVCESPILHERTDTSERFLVCVPYKNGWNWWASVLCASEQGHRCPTAYKETTSLLHEVWWRHSDAEVADLYADKQLRKIKLVRNSLTRVLAAWLTWVTKYTNTSKEYNYVEEDFGDFVSNSMIKRRNCHWSPQILHCGEDEAVGYEVLKVEERSVWGPQTLDRLGLKAGAELLGGISTKLKSRCPGHQCSANPLMLKYYTPGLVAQVKAHYQEEITLYNYTSEFERWEDMIWEDLVRGEGEDVTMGLTSSVTASQASVDLAVLDMATMGFAEERAMNSQLEEKHNVAAAGREN